MSNLHSLIIVNILILITLVISIFQLISNYIIIPIIIILLLLNIFIIYKKSNTFDKNEEKKKFILHKIKNSLSIILGYTTAFNDNIITKEELDKNLNEEIETIISVIKEEIYKK